MSTSSIEGGRRCLFLGSGPEHQPILVTSFDSEVRQQRLPPLPVSQAKRRHEVDKEPLALSGQFFLGVGLLLLGVAAIWLVSGYQEKIG